MDEKTLQTLLERAGLAVDDGGRISGPFIPDGVTRIYDPETSRVLGRGDTLAEAASELDLEDLQ